MVISQYIKYGISCACSVLIVAFVLAECQLCVGRLEAEIRERSAQVGILTTQLEETQADKSQLAEQVASINSLLEASQTSKKEDNKQVRHTFPFFFYFFFLKWQTPDRT